MRMYPFSDERIIDEIKGINKEEKEKTILLLDAFDEDYHLLKLHNDPNLTDEARFRKRLDEVMSAVRDFRRVIITSRTQYFPDKQQKDYELNIPKHNGEGFHKLGILYIAPFDNKEVKRYLRKRYGVLRFWNGKHKRKALKIIEGSPSLMVRPMLLSHIDLLVKSDRDYQNTYEIYETLVEKWLDREKDRQKERFKESFKTDMYRFSRLAALEMYHRGSTTLEKNDAIELAGKHGLTLKNYEITGRSLLNHDSSGNWKFAHKSILEYFIAKEALKDLKFGFDMDWTGWDMALHFYREMDGFEIEIEMIFVEGGSSRIGDKTPIHRVTLPSFLIGKYPVTQKQWTAIMGKNPSRFKGENLPVERISWHDAKEFIEKLNQKTGKQFRLPSEAEWEFAAKGGSKSKGYVYSGSNKLEEVGWFEENSKRKTQEVGQLKANELGIYDMGGNVWEWCEDDWHKNYQNAPVDGSAWIDEPRGTVRVLRGGSWGAEAVNCRSSYRGYDFPDGSTYNYGFRLAHSLEGHPIF